jgi:hypothetical protein
MELDIYTDLCIMAEDGDGGASYSHVQLR